MLSFWWVRHAPVINNNNCCYGDNEVECDTSNKVDFINLVDSLPKNAQVFTSPFLEQKKHLKPQLRQGINMIHILKIHV